MPFVRRKVIMRAGPGRQIKESFSDIYLRPDEELRESDVVRKPSAKELADVQSRFPEDFKEEKEVETEKSSRKTEPKESPLDNLSQAASRFIALRWQIAVQKVESISPEATDLLQELYDAELIREGGPRSSVMDAFREKGFVPRQEEDGTEGGEGGDD